MLIQSLAKFIYEKVLRWKIVGEFPNLAKFVIIVVPHTSWHDFYIGVLVRCILQFEANFVAKKELFFPPLGWYFRWMGGAPLDRSENQNKVKEIGNIYRQRDVFRLAIAPEGTRKKVAKWKTGFYYIAKEADVPILMVAFDYASKEVRFSELFFPTDDIEADFKFMHANFAGVIGKVP